MLVYTARLQIVPRNVVVSPPLLKSQFQQLTALTASATFPNSSMHRLMTNTRKTAPDCILYSIVQKGQASACASLPSMASSIWRCTSWTRSSTSSWNGSQMDSMPGARGKNTCNTIMQCCCACNVIMCNVVPQCRYSQTYFCKYSHIVSQSRHSRNVPHSQYNQSPV